MSNILILASGSAARKTMLRNAGYQFDIKPADINEQSVIDQGLEEGVNFQEIALSLSLEKSKAVAANHKDRYIIGSDQLLVCEDVIYSKAQSIEEAKKKLQRLRGKKHQLISAVNVIKNDDVLFQDCDVATLTMKNVDDEWLDQYLRRSIDVAVSCVGSYAIEGYGIRLFKKIDGDFFTIMGMPLMGLIDFLDREGIGS
ncbi:MAG: nucleoside triphosphate pyrophosphatase [Pseudomonadota bacterium]